MRRLWIHLVSIHLGLAAVPGFSVAASGTVSFEFTGFSGPMARSSEADATDPSKWGSKGLVNGSLPIANGWVSDGSTVPFASGYVMGSRQLSGASASFYYDWVDPASAGANVISFTPASFSNVALGQSFVLGTLSYQNGFWYGAGNTALYNTPVELGFRIQTVSNDGPAFNKTLVGALRNVIHQVPNDGGFLPANYEAEADWVYLHGAGVSLSMGAFRVFDNCCKPAGASNVGSVQILGRFNSLDIDAFGAVEGGGFVTLSVAPIPEPGSWAMLLAGLGLLGFAARCRKQKAA
jgi:hypothetical protein